MPRVFSHHQIADDAHSGLRQHVALFAEGELDHAVAQIGAGEGLRRYNR